jgi:hypothetical protein
MFRPAGFYGKVFVPNRFAARKTRMSALARKFKPEPLPEAAPRRRTFHASVLVARIEEWKVEAVSVEEARALLAAGQGHRLAPGERVHVEVERILDDAT